MTNPPVNPPADPPANPYADPLVDHREWQRLDPLMLLVHPVRELIRFLPALIGVLVAGSASGGHDWWWNVIGVGVPVGLGLARYLTTSFRIADGRVELRRGLLNKHVLSTPVDRVRTVDITASPIHRILGLTTVRIGTGTASKKGEDELDLDGIRTHAADALRADLLRRTSEPVHAQQPAAPGDEARRVVRFDPAWVRFAPFTSSGLIIAAAVLGGGSQLMQSLGLWDHLRLDHAAQRLAGLSLLLLVPGLLVGLVVIASVLAVGGYLVQNFGFTLTYARADHAWHLRRGLFTTRETSMDASRMRGVSLGEPLGLRLVSGARLSAIVTGLDREERGSSILVPPAPRDLVTAVAGTVLGSSEPVEGPLTGHGPAALRRRYTRALALPVLVTLAVGTGVPAFGWTPDLLVLSPVAVAAGLVLAADRTRALGHALIGGYLVSRSGSLARRRVALETQAVIGWTFTSSWFQRRVGLTTLVATMAGGRQAVTVLDIPEDAATALTVQALPGLVSQFLAPERDLLVSPAGR